MTFYAEKMQQALKRASIEFDRPITLRDIHAPTRYKHAKEPRWFCMAYMHVAGGYSQTVLGKIFKRDSTTILHGLRRAHGHDGKLIHHHEPLWTKEHFVNLAARDGFWRRPPRAYEPVNVEQLLSIGLRNLQVYTERFCLLQQPAPGRSAA